MPPDGDRFPTIDVAREEIRELPGSRLLEASHQVIHAVPHRTDAVLLGLVNVRGQLRICVSLHGLLGVEAPATAGGERTPGTSSPRPRMLIVRDRASRWVFPVEEVVGVRRFPPGRLRRVPSTFPRDESFARAVFDWKGTTVGYLDEARLFSTLRSQCQ